MVMHQSVPVVPSSPPPRGGLAFFLPWMANSPGWGLLSYQIPWGGDKKRRQMPRPPTKTGTFFVDRTVG